MATTAIVQSITLYAHDGVSMSVCADRRVLTEAAASVGAA